jgi:selenocysteine lyase/cysteine desulfurase
MEPIEARRLFPLANGYIHMNHAGVSPMSQRAGAAVARVVEARVLGLATRLAEGLARIGCEIVEPWPRTTAESSGIVSFRKPEISATAALSDLTAARVIARTHQDFVRLSPHFYNTDEEVDRVLEVMSGERVPQ